MPRTRTLSTDEGDTSTPRKAPKGERTRAPRKPRPALAESPPAPVAPTRVGLTPENLRFFKYLALLGADGFAVLSLLSYSPTDPAFSRRSSVEEVANWCGRTGAVLADILLQVLGYAAWTVLPLGAWLVLRFARREGASLPRLALGLLGTWWFATLVGLLAWPDAGVPYPVGGALGSQTAILLLQHLGAVGSYVAVMLILLAGTALLVDVNWEHLAGRSVDAVHGTRPVVAGVLRRSGQAAFGALHARGRRVWTAASGRLKTRAAPTPDTDSTGWEELVWDEDLSVAQDRTPAMPLPIRIDPPVSGPRTLAFRALHEPALDEPEERTVWAQRELVEVDVASATPDAPLRADVEVEDEDTDEVDAQQALYSGASPRSALDAPSLDALSVLKPARGPAIVRPPEPEAPAAPPVILPPVIPPPVLTPVVAAAPAIIPPAAVAAADEDAFWGSRDPFGADDEGDDEVPAADEAADDDDSLDDLEDEDGPQSYAAPARPAPRPSAPARPAAASRALVQPGNLVSGGDDEAEVGPRRPVGGWRLPELGLLDVHDRAVSVLDEDELKAQAAALVEKLANFNIKGEVVAIRPGPVITIFEYLPAPGIKVSRIAALADDLAMALRALRVRIVAPIPGKGVVGIEIPNKERQTVWYRDVLVSNEMREGDWVLPMALGKSPDGRPAIADLTRMPHLLVGGTTGSGKSVGVNAMLMTMLYYRTPEELRMILIDPKMLEFELYQDIPHLLHPVVTEPKLASAALKWACKEMDDRYRLLARWGTRNIASYNKKVDQELLDWSDEKAWRYAPRGAPRDQAPPQPRKLPYIVIVIDELADLMMVAAKDVEESIVRLAQKARACGIHLIVATQRPSVDVITGLIKANMPSRIAFQVRSKTDGRTILDQNGAETLLGKGDMLYLPPGVSALARIHGPFVADEEVQRVADCWREQGEPLYEAEIRVEDEEGEQPIGEDEYDECYDMAVQIVTEAGKASTSMIQRRLKIGYNRAARIIEMMERDGLVGPADGARPRDVLVGNG